MSSTQKTPGIEAAPGTPEPLGDKTTVDGSTPDFDSLIRRIFPEVSANQSLQKPATGKSRNYATAFDLLARASAAFETLTTRYEKIESEFKGFQEQAASEIDAANEVTRQWQHLAAAMKVHLEDGEKRYLAMRMRAEDAEARLAGSREAVATAEKQAAMAMDLTILFHDRIVAAFGIGSPAHTTLDAAAQGKLIEPPPMLPRR